MLVEEAKAMPAESVRLEWKSTSTKYKRELLFIQIERATLRMRGIYGNSLYHIIFYLRTYIRLIF